MTECTCGKCSGQPMLSSEALEALEKHHDFPGPYMFKAIGYAADGFVEDVRKAAEKVLGEVDPEKDIRVRPSANGKYESVTIEVDVSGSEQVLAVYEALRHVEGIITIV